MGIWHGSSIKYVIGEGLWFWLVIVIGNISDPVFQRIWEKLHISKDNALICIFRITRTLVLVSIGNVFFRAESFMRSLEMFKLAFSETVSYNIVNLLKDYNVGRTALGDFVGLVLWFVAIAMVICYEIMCYKQENPLLLLSNKSMVLRWITYWTIAIIISYSIFEEQSTFIYAGF